MSSLPISLKHNFQSLIPDGVNSALVRPSEWNANHVLTATGPSVLAVEGIGTGAVVAIQLDSTSGGATRWQIPAWNATAQAMQFRHSFEVLGPIGSSFGLVFNTRASINVQSGLPLLPSVPDYAISFSSS